MRKQQIMAMSKDRICQRHSGHFTNGKMSTNVRTDISGVGKITENSSSNFDRGKALTKLV